MQSSGCTFERRQLARSSTLCIMRPLNEYRPSKLPSTFVLGCQIVLGSLASHYVEGSTRSKSQVLMWTTIEPSVTPSTIAVLGDGNQPKSTKYPIRTGQRRLCRHTNFPASYKPCNVIADIPHAVYMVVWWQASLAQSYPCRRRVE